MADPAAQTPALVPVSETTPLLTPQVEPVQVEPQEQTSDDSGTASAADRTLPVVIATWLELIAGVLSVSFGVACAIIRSASPVGFRFPWMITNILPGDIFFCVVAVFFAIYNLVQLRRVNKTLPVLLNIVVDLPVAFALLTIVGQAWESVSFDCSRGYGDNKLPDDVLHHCEEWGRLVMPILWFFVVLSGLVGFTALFLFLARCILLSQRRRTWGSTWARWQLPTGRLAVEFTIKLLRQETSQDTAAALDGRETTGA
ncbi:hypothetical protein CONLIGDRAFT_679464 [Coniochaeta ligniaria NRRL 30616]|uniref:MARVEL domain-containing protein n=1 Tax=Coniochaeta ligniaria NRRL 30616 TaxID=1408157 RepID=A0A1J7JSG2_9PEZI|nr:hypothetical protein CONLIGDRAFT_679464 [Coniochaeta ligniaria NRRL 30616]